MGKLIKLVLMLIVAAAFTGAGYYMGTSETKPPVLREALSSTGKTPVNVEKRMIAESFLFLESLRKISPEKYKEIKREMGDYDSMTYEQKLAWVNKITELTAVLLIDRVPYASDAALNDFAVVVKEQADGYLIKDPSGQLCFNNFFPGLNKFPQDKLAVSYNEADIRMLKTVNLILTSSLENRNNHSVSEHDAWQILGSVSQKLSEKYGDQVNLLSNPEEGAKDPAMTCRIVGDFYELFTQEPDKAASAEALRQILSD